MMYNFTHYNDPKCCLDFTQEYSKFSDDELEEIRVLGDALDKSPVKVYGPHDSSVVDADGGHFKYNDGTMWVYDRLANMIQDINSRTFKYDLTGFSENLYFNTYVGTSNHHFSWHYDMGPKTAMPRKLTVVLQLSDPSEYEGGELQFMGIDDPLVATKAKGLLVAFPSYRAHRVTPVTSGFRRTLVAFVTGPNFK